MRFYYRILLGRNSVIRKALGSTPESEHLPNASKIAAALEGDVGLLFTDEEQEVVEEWFESFKRPDFARAGNIALEGFTVPQGRACSIDAFFPKRGYCSFEWRLMICYCLCLYRPNHD